VHESISLAPMLTIVINSGDEFTQDHIEPQPNFAAQSQQPEPLADRESHCRKSAHWFARVRPIPNLWN
jgi:hypothetical protein